MTTTIEALHPGVRIIENFEDVPAIEGVGTSVGALVGEAERGSIAKAVITTSMTSFRRNYGFKQTAMTIAAKQFFENGGQRLAISRVAVTGVQASLTIGTANASLKVTAIQSGISTITLEIITPTGGSTVIVVTGNDIVVTPASAATANDVISAINTDQEAHDLVNASLPSGGDGTDAIVAAAQASLTGGVGAAFARSELKDYSDNDLIDLKAIGVGSYGNKVGAVVSKVETTLDGLIAAGATTSIVVNNISGFARGDVVQVGTDVDKFTFVVHTINTTTRTLTFGESVTVGGSGQADAAVVATCSTHRLSTTSTTALATGGDRITVSTEGVAIVGQILTITDGTTQTDVTITAINGAEIIFGAVTLGTTINAGAIAVSQEFDILFTGLDGAPDEYHKFLSMSDTNERDYIEVRLGPQLKIDPSLYMSLEDKESVTTVLHLRIPAPTLSGAILLAGGLDGGTPQAIDYIGVQTEGSKTGMFLFDAVQINMLAAPGQNNTTVAVGGESYVENRNLTRASFMTAVPVGILTDLDAADYRNNTTNIDSSRASMYWPHVLIANPFGGTEDLIADPVGPMMGQWALVALTRGVHKAPANIPLNNILGLETDGLELDFDAVQDVLNPIGVNVIRPYAGQGIRCEGARTLWSTPDGRQFIHKRRTLDFIEDSIQADSLWVNFEPTDEDLLRRLFTFVDQFLEGVWTSGALFPQSDRSKAWVVICNAENNPPAQLLAGTTKCRIGVNIVGMNEFTFFTVGGNAGALRGTIDEQI